MFDVGWEWCKIQRSGASMDAYNHSVRPQTGANHDVTLEDCGKDNIFRSVYAIPLSWIIDLRLRLVSMIFSFDWASIGRKR